MKRSNPLLVFLIQIPTASAFVNKRPFGLSTTNHLSTSSYLSAESEESILKEVELVNELLNNDERKSKSKVDTQSHSAPEQKVEDSTSTISEGNRDSKAEELSGTKSDADGEGLETMSRKTGDKDPEPRNCEGHSRKETPSDKKDAVNMDKVENDAGTDMNEIKNDAQVDETSKYSNTAKGNNVKEDSHSKGTVEVGGDKIESSNGSQRQPESKKENVPTGQNVEDKESSHSNSMEGNENDKIQSEKAEKLSDEPFTTDSKQKQGESKEANHGKEDHNDEHASTNSEKVDVIPEAQTKGRDNTEVPPNKESLEESTNSNLGRGTNEASQQPKINEEGNPALSKASPSMDSKGLSTESSIGEDRKQPLESTQGTIQDTPGDNGPFSDRSAGGQGKGSTVELQKGSSSLSEKSSENSGASSASVSNSSQQSATSKLQDNNPPSPENAEHATMQLQPSTMESISSNSHSVPDIISKSSSPESAAASSKEVNAIQPTTDSAMGLSTPTAPDLDHYNSATAGISDALNGAQQRITNDLIPFVEKDVLPTIQKGLKATLAACVHMLDGAERALQAILDAMN